MATFTTDNKISPIHDMIKEGIKSDKSIYILINEVLFAHGKGKLCEFQRSTDGTNPKRLWTKAEYTDEIANKYNHFTGKLISVCKILYSGQIKAIENLNEELTELAVADKMTDNDIATLFDKLDDLKAGGKMKLGGQSGGSSFSDVLAIAIKISKMLDPSVALPEALKYIDPVIIRTWIASLIEKANSKPSKYISFLFNDILTPIFPSIVFSLQSIKYAAENQDLLIEYIAVYGPIYIDRIIDTLRSIAQVGSKSENLVMSAIEKLQDNRTNLALSDLAFQMKEDEEIRLKNKTIRLASLEKVQKKLTDAKVKAADLKTELEGQKEILKEVKKIVAETKTFIEDKDMMSEELIQINNELEHLLEEPKENELAVAIAKPIPPTAPQLSEKQVAEQEAEQARLAEKEEEQARNKRLRSDVENRGDLESNKRPKTNSDDPNGPKPGDVETGNGETGDGNKGGKRKTKKQQKKASKTKKPKRSQKKQTKKRKQRKTQQKKGKK